MLLIVVQSFFVITKVHSAVLTWEKYLTESLSNLRTSRAISWISHKSSQPVCSGSSYNISANSDPRFNDAAFWKLSLPVKGHFLYYL